MEVSGGVGMVRPTMRRDERKAHVRAPILCGIDQDMRLGDHTDFACRLAGSLACDVIFAHIITGVGRVPVVLAGGPGTPGIVPPVSYDNPESERIIIERAVARLDSLIQGIDGVDILTRATLASDPPTGLRRLANEESARMIVLAARGLGALKTALIGSTSHSLVIESPCPVVVTPARSGS